MASTAAPHEGRRIPEWSIRERMAKARETAGYTQAEMGAFFGVKAETISSWETDTRQPKDFFDKLRRWAEITKVDYDWLVTGKGAIVTYADGLVIVDEGQLLLPIELPPSRSNPALTLV